MSSPNLQSGICDLESRLGRRALLKAGLAAGAGLLLRGAEAAEGEAKVRVVAATNSKVFGEGNALRPAAVQELVDAAVARLMD
jgi:hypothetical protein